MICTIPHTHYKGFQCPKGFEIPLKIDKKCDVKTRPLKRTQLYALRSAQREKGDEKASERDPQGLPGPPQMSKSGFQKRSCNTL